MELLHVPVYAVCFLAADRTHRLHLGLGVDLGHVEAQVEVAVGGVAAQLTLLILRLQVDVVLVFPGGTTSIKK